MPISPRWRSNSPEIPVAIVAEETNKSLDAMPAIMCRMRDLGVNRKTHLIAVGGGARPGCRGLLRRLHARYKLELPSYTMLSMAGFLHWRKILDPMSASTRILVGMIYPQEVPD